MNKILILYAFHEYNQRVKYFIKKALFKKENIDFLFIANNLSITRENINLPSYVFFLNRKNEGFDFAAWSYGLLKNDIYKNYEYFIFVNSSVIGPFLYVYYTEDWVNIYINPLKHNNVKLFGSTINTKYYPHVQSYIFSMNIITLQFLINNKIFSLTKFSNDFIDTIFNKEILMSKLILQKKWNIGCLLKRYKNIDFTNLKQFDLSVLLI